MSANEQSELNSPGRLKNGYGEKLKRMIMKMKIKINGIEKEIPENTTISELLSSLNILDKTMAVAVNMKIVKKDNWKNYKLQDGDKIEALNFVGGG